jgi:hypothetical protein
MRRYSIVAAAILLVAATMPVRGLAQDLTSLKPGLSGPDAFMAREPAAPASGAEALHIHPVVVELDRKLGVERTYINKHANDTSGQAFPGGGNSQPTLAQEMAMATRMRGNGTMQAMQLLAAFMTDAHHQAHIHLWTQRMQEATDALGTAEDWLADAKHKLKQKYQADVRKCPRRTTGELTERDPACMRSQIRAYEEKMHYLAAAYLKKVDDSLSNLLLVTKMLVDEQEEFAKKMQKVGNGPLVIGQVASIQAQSFADIKGYNDKVLRATNVAVDLANFKVSSGY